MSKIEIRSEDRVLSVEDIESLVELVRSGRIGRAAQVKLPGSDAFVRVDSLDAVSGVLERDPWSAWDAETDESVLEAFVPKEIVPPAKESVVPSQPKEDAVEELPASAVAPMETAVVEKPIPLKAVPPEVESPSITPSSKTHPGRSPRRPPAKVIAFPQPTDAHVDGMHALAMDLTPRNDRVKVDGYSRVRWSRVIVLGVLGVAITSLWVWYVDSNATAHFASRSKAVAAATPTLPPPLTELEIAEEVSPYEMVEDILRNELMEGILDIPGETDFEDALLIELRRVRVDVRSVRVKIDTWAGRKKDIPDEVSFQIKVVARDGELDRDLGGLGLVLGKYIQHYGLQVTNLDIVLSADDGLRKIRMNPEIARRYFTHRVSLERFLSSAFAAQ